MNRREVLNLISAVLQFAVAAAGGAWAGHAVDPTGPGFAIGMAGMAMGLAAGYAFSNMLGLIFAPVVMAQILRKARATHDPQPTDAAARHDFIGIAMTLVVMGVCVASAIVVALLVWALADHAPLFGTLWRFLLVSLVVAVMAPGARRVVV